MGGGTAYTKKGSSFVFSNWIEEPFELSPVDISTLDLPGSKKATLLLKYREIELVVSEARALASDPHTSSSTKRKIEFTGRTVEAIRKATTYFTAAATMTVSFYVATEVERAHLLHLVELNTRVNPLESPQQLPLATQIPVAIPVEAPLASPAPPSSNSSHAAHVKQLIDDGFRSLEEATDLEEREEWHKAYQAYEHARRCFNQACPHIPSDKVSTRQLLLDKASEIQATMADLQCHLAPPASSIPSHFAPTVPPAQVLTAPPPQPISPARSNKISEPSSPSMDERMYKLQKFSEAVEVKRAQEETKPVVEDLALRLAALKKETTVAPSISSLEERFQRLRGGATPSPPLSMSPPIDLLVDLHGSSTDNTAELDTEALEDNDDNDEKLLEDAKHVLAQVGKVDDAVAVVDEDKQVAALIQQVHDELAHEPVAVSDS
ncbi:unnamed protein product [Aphanomyces euteiches]